MKQRSAFSRFNFLISLAKKKDQTNLFIYNNKISFANLHENIKFKNGNKQKKLIEITPTQKKLDKCLRFPPKT